MANLSSLSNRLEKVPVKVNKWNAQEVKIALDDLVAKYFVEEAHYKEINTLLNWKLLFSASLTLIGGATSLYGYLIPFSDARLIVGIGAALYFIVLGAYTLWLAFLHTSTCFRGMYLDLKKGGKGKTIWIESQLEVPAALYRLTLLDPTTSKKTDISMAWDISSWIKEDGVVSGDEFCASMEKFAKSDNFKSYIKSD